MDRLTQKDDQGNWSLKGVPWMQLYVGVPMAREVHEKLYGALWKLMEYEDTGLDPEEVERMQEEVQQYRQIGTVEECRTAREKQIAKVPAYEGDGYDPDGNIILDEWLCPNCGTRYEVDYDDYDYCPNCGQAIKNTESEEIMTENESKLIDAIMRHRFACPLNDESDIDFDKECVGYKEEGCKECVFRHIDNLE